MVHIIIKPTRREREANLAESRSRSSHRGISGVVRTTEEASEIARQREREGIPFSHYIAVSNDSPEAKQAAAENLLRAGINPETMQPLSSDSTRHDVDHSNDVIGTRDGKPVRAKDFNGG